MWFDGSRKASVVLPVGRVKEARAEAQAPGSKLIRIQSASFSILPSGMLDWRGSPSFGKHSPGNKFRCHGPRDRQGSHRQQKTWPRPRSVVRWCDTGAGQMTLDRHGHQRATGFLIRPPMPTMLPNRGQERVI
jgi:hypothetical protein